VRFFFAILLAALAGTLLSSALLFHGVSRWSFVALPFVLVGTATIALIFYRLVEFGWKRRFAYVLVAPIGGAVGALMLSVPAGFVWRNCSVGLAYGGVTAICWTVVSLAVERFQGHARTPSAEP